LMLAGGLLYVLSIGILEIERISAGLDSFSAISPPLKHRKRHRCPPQSRAHLCRPLLPA
jgi:hypothetical protein